MAGHTAGLSPLGAFKALIEGGLDQQEYSKLWFANGGFPPGVFKNSELEVEADQSRAIRANLTETLRRRQPLVIGRDWDYTPISVKPEEAQFVETDRLTATEFAAIYQVPPERIGGCSGDPHDVLLDRAEHKRPDHLVAAVVDRPVGGGVRSDPAAEPSSRSLTWTRCCGRTR